MEFTTESTGTKVVINPADLDSAFKLKSSLIKSLKAADIELADAFGEKLFDAIMAIDSSKEVFDDIFNCLKKSTYNGIKITKDVFEDESARSDIYEVFLYCLKVNVYPFFKSLLSQLSSNQEENGENQEQG